LPGKSYFFDYLGDPKLSSHNRAPISDIAALDSTEIFYSGEL
jgi:hypothetical protein